MTAYLAKTAAVVSVVLLAASSCVCSAQTTITLDDLQAQVQALQSQNKELHEQLARQQNLLERLNDRVEERSLTQTASDEEAAPRTGGFLQELGGGRVKFSGQGAVGFYDTSSNGAFPNSEFRVGEARLFLDARLMEDVYFFTELNLTTRETDEEELELGELYVDFENVSRFFNRERLLNVRVGRFDIPFGEEYLTRDAIDNPLISHSLSDIWGVDEGIELYGGIAKFSYVFAVQNGGHPLLNDGDSDKAVILKLGYEPARWAKLSISAMRTGDLTVAGDELSEVWFGGGFVRNISGAATMFDAEIYEADVHFLIPRGHLKLWGGYMHSDDNAPLGLSERGTYYYAAEALHNLTKKFYAAGRFSQILSEDGLPIVGLGAFGPFMFNNANLTKDLWRMSLGLGYRLRPNLMLKGEFSHEEGRIISGRRRETDMFAAELAFGF